MPPRVIDCSGKRETERRRDRERERERERERHVDATGEQKIPSASRFEQISTSVRSDRSDNGTKGAGRGGIVSTATLPAAATGSEGLSRRRLPRGCLVGT